ncbi:ubiquitin domain-containing protein 2-like isoform X2 [Dysidea avara]|uniref:ubiquitin domain-containing protein 2-like isoform X2 n=1 Tax=Dysidea avara TaxID=196820 RepID=UPI00332919AF
MGNCFGTGNRRRLRGATDVEHGVAVGKNQPLLRVPVMWSSDVIATDGQLQGKRDEFWDTAPAFEGRREVWDALKAAAEAAELKDYDLAQAIVDGAGISLPKGTLEECYDELGSRYVIPKYCLNKPTNFTSDTGGAAMAASPDQLVPVDQNEEKVNIKLRLSTGKDVKLSVYPSTRMSEVKKMLQSSEGIDAVRTRLLFSGKLVSDSATIEQLKIPKGFVLQVIVS